MNAGKTKGGTPPSGLSCFTPPPIALQSPTIAITVPTGRPNSWALLFLTNKTEGKKHHRTQARKRVVGERQGDGEAGDYCSGSESLRQKGAERGDCEGRSTPATKRRRRGRHQAGAGARSGAPLSASFCLRLSHRGNRNLPPHLPASHERNPLPPPHLQKKFPSPFSCPPHPPVV